MISRIIVGFAILTFATMLVASIGISVPLGYGQAGTMGLPVESLPNNEGASSTRSVLLDNAKIFAMFLVMYHHILVIPEVFSDRLPQPLWLQDSRQCIVFLVSAITKVHLPMFCLISGILSQSAVSPQRVDRFLFGLLFPTLIWVYFAGPVVANTLAFPSSFMKWVHEFLHFQGYAGLWYIQALVCWRCSAFLLWSRLRPAVCLPAMLVLSVFAGYTNFGGVLQSVFGFLPYFGVGFVLPFDALEMGTRRLRSGPVVIAVLLAVVIYLFALLPAMALDRPWPSPYEGYYYPRPFPTPELYETLSFEANVWEMALFGMHRLGVTAVCLIPTLALLFFVLPRGWTPLSWAAPYTIHQYAFHIIAHIWLVRSLMWFWQHLGLPALTSSAAHIFVLLLYVPYCLVLIYLFSSSPWRRMWAWCFEPTWLKSLIAIPAVGKEAPNDRTPLFSK